MKELFGVRGDAAGAPRGARVKICGITNRADAEVAIALGADALGFNAWPGSKRFLDVRREADWIRALPPLATKVVVTVNATLAEVEALHALRLFGLVQLHGSEDAAFCRLLAARGIPYMKAVAVGAGSPLANVEEFGGEALLVDTSTPSGFGGTGEFIDLEAVAAFQAAHPSLRLVVSGGLRPGNVAEVVRRLRPRAVDVASGVEREPRRKDSGLLGSFLDAVRSA